MSNKELDKELGRAFLHSENLSEKTEENMDDKLAEDESEDINRENSSRSAENEPAVIEKSKNERETQGQSDLKESKNFKRQRVIRTSNKDKIQQSEDSRAKQKRVLETAMRKSMSLSIIISIILAGLIYFSSLSLNYYKRQSEERKSSEPSYVDLFQRLGLRAKDAVVNDSYVSNKEKVERQYQLSLEKKSEKEQDADINSANFEAPDNASNDAKVELNPGDDGNLSNRVENGENDKNSAHLSDSESDENSNAKNGNNTIKLNTVDKQNLQNLLGKGPIDYKSAKSLFNEEHYKDVKEMLGSKDTLVSLEKVEDGYIQHFPYLNLFAAGEYPLLPKSQEVSDAYFEDSCFIGDSIMSIFAAGSSYYADFFARPNMDTVNALDEFEFSNNDGQEGTVRELLKYKQYNKIYILLGTNDAAFGDADDFKVRYRKIVEYVRESQPDAEIYLLALFPVSAYYEEEGRYPTNGFFASLNKALMELCQETGNFFLDYGSYMRSAYGVLPDEAAKDGIHFTIAYVPAWEEYISTHTWDGALSLLDPSIKLQTKQAAEEEKLSLEESLPDLNEKSVASIDDDIENVDQNDSEKDPKTDANNKSAKDKNANDKDGKQDENSNIDKSILANKERSIKNNQLAIAEEGKNTPSVESMSSVYEAAFNNNDGDIKERLDSLYSDIIDRISFDDKMSSIKIKNIPSFYGLDINSIVDARILRGSGATAEELMIFRFESEDEAMDARQKLVNYRQKRIDSYSDYVPSEVPRLEKARIVRQGKYLFFVVATDSNLLESIVDNY